MFMVNSIQRVAWMEDGICSVIIIISKRRQKACDPRGPTKSSHWPVAQRVVVEVTDG